jgi:hypothetical protein
MHSVATSERSLTGRVVFVNDNGLKFEGAGEWLNYSKYAVGIVAPEKNQTVTVTLNKSGFIRSCSVMGAEPARVAGGSDAQRPDRERLIVRQSSAKTAFDFAASRPDMKAADALRLAAILEEWVLRDDESELTDAF